MRDTDTQAKPHQKWFEAQDLLDNIKVHIFNVEQALVRCENSNLPYTEISLDHIIETLTNIEDNLTSSTIADTPLPLN
jgi:hypothetical protein